MSIYGAGNWGGGSGSQQQQQQLGGGSGGGWGGGANQSMGGGGGIYGGQAQQQQGGGSVYSQPQPQQQPQGGSMYGQPQQTQGGSIYGQPQQQQQAAGGSIYGQPQQQQPQGGSMYDQGGGGDIFGLMGSGGGGGGGGGGSGIYSSSANPGLLGAQPSGPAPTRVPTKGEGYPLAPGVDIMTYPGAALFTTQQQQLATSAAESPAAAQAIAATATITAMQNGALDAGEALQTLRKDVENMCQKFQAMVATATPMLLPDARAGAAAHAAAIVGSTPGFSQGVDSTLKSMQASNQNLQGLKDARSTRDFALSAVASQKSAVKSLMTTPPRGEGATRVKREADARQTVAAAGADLERAAQGLERAEHEVRLHVSCSPDRAVLSYAAAHPVRSLFAPSSAVHRQG